MGNFAGMTEEMTFARGSEEMAFFLLMNLHLHSLRSLVFFGGGTFRPLEMEQGIP
jgi:hypothetical protein